MRMRMRMGRDTFKRFVIFLTALLLSGAFFATTFVVKKTHEDKKFEEALCCVNVQQVCEID